MKERQELAYIHHLPAAVSSLLPSYYIVTPIHVADQKFWPLPPFKKSKQARSKMQIKLVSNFTLKTPHLPYLLDPLRQQHPREVPAGQAGGGATLLRAAPPSGGAGDGGAGGALGGRDVWEGGGICERVLSFCRLREFLRKVSRMVVMSGGWKAERKK